MLVKAKSERLKHPVSNIYIFSLVVNEGEEPQIY